MRCKSCTADRRDARSPRGFYVHVSDIISCTEFASLFVAEYCRLHAPENQVRHTSQLYKSLRARPWPDDAAIGNQGVNCASLIFDLPEIDPWLQMVAIEIHQFPDGGKCRGGKRRCFSADIRPGNNSDAVQAFALARLIADDVVLIYPGVTL